MIRCPCCTDRWTRTSASALDGTRRAGQNGDVGPRSWRFLLRLVLAVVMGARFVGEQPARREAPRAGGGHPVDGAAVSAHGRSRVEIRGVHVTGALASLSGKFKEYVGYKRYGLNTIELDIKDEAGEIGFAPPNVPLAQRSARTGSFTTRRRWSQLAHRNGIYMIGRVVCFQDPMLAAGGPTSPSSVPGGACGRRRPGSAG